MNPRIQHLIQHPFEVQLSDVAMLQDEIEKYPYFSTLRTLLLFGLKEFDHSSYQEELKKTSIHCPSRVALYHYLQRERQISTQVELEEIPIIISEGKEEITQTFVEKEASETVTESHQEVETLESDQKSETKAEDIFDEKEPMPVDSELTFSEWLSLSTKPVKTDEKSTFSEPNERDIKYKLIDEFIEKSPRIAPITSTDEVKPAAISSDDSAEFSDLMTETLAQIYTEQKMYSKAIRAYRILILKYPDKKEDFEFKIAEIENQRDN